MQIYGDPEAADVVFTSGANIVVVGINITTQVKFTGFFHFLNHGFSHLWSKC
jgi:putative N-acetylmannosamine-6-phosphate epimerase